MSNPFTISTKINAPKNDCWNKLTKGEHITHWNFASDDWKCPNAEIDTTIGGSLSYRMESKDGKMGFDLSGIITEIDTGNSYSYQMPDGRTVKHKLEETEDGTIITQEIDPENEHPIDMQIQGWTAILNNFKKYCEQ